MNSVYMLGIGPGDPELVTVKGVNLLKDADIIYVPESDSTGRSVAEAIITPYVRTEQLRKVYFPMTNDTAELDRRYNELAAEIHQQYKAGKKVVYVTLGDSMLYSTAQYVTRSLRCLGVIPVFIPGIPSYVACANIAGVSLADKGEDFLVTALPASVNEIKTEAEKADTVIFMKIAHRLPVLIEYVKKHNPAKALLIKRGTLENQELMDLKKEQALPEEAGYLFIAILKRGTHETP